MIDNKNTHKENWLALLLSITYVKEKNGYYSCDEAFIRSGAKSIKTTQSRVIAPPSYTVMQGTVIEATLTTG